jgi:hypothetical protein
MLPRDPVACGSGPRVFSRFLEDPLVDKPMPSRRLIGLIVFAGVIVLADVAVGEATEFRVKVMAGNVDRNDAPVSVDLQLPETQVREPACVAAGGKTAPAQIEYLGDGKARAWWLVSNLPAGQSRTYILKLGSACDTPQTEAFAWKDSSTGKLKTRDLMLGDRPVLRYMYSPYDGKDEESIERTKKPFHHVFDPNGSQLITKGAGGLYPHHRGIFFGYKRCCVGEGVYDLWHAHKGEHQLHTKTIREMTGPVMGGHVVSIDWNDRQKKTFAVETRRVVAFRQSPDHLLIEFSSAMHTVRGRVSLDGDPQHGGVQWRGAQEVADNKTATRYLRPARWASLPSDQKHNAPDYKDLPWNAIQYKLGERAYTVAYLTDPANPGNAEFSERLYGRFGEFFPWSLRKDNPLSMRYRWWIAATHAVTREQLDNKYQDLADPPKATLE